MVGEVPLYASSSLRDRRRATRREHAPGRASGEPRPGRLLLRDERPVVIDPNPGCLRPGLVPTTRIGGVPGPGQEACGLCSDGEDGLARWAPEVPPTRVRGLINDSPPGRHPCATPSGAPRARRALGITPISLVREPIGTADEHRVRLFVPLTRPILKANSPALPRRDTGGVPSAPGRCRAPHPRRQPAAISGSSGLSLRGACVRSIP